MLKIPTPVRLALDGLLFGCGLSLVLTGSWLTGGVFIVLAVLFWIADAADRS